MPSAYTATIYDREDTFKVFAWRCARAFGALIMQREESFDAPIKIPEEEDGVSYYEKALGEWRELLAEAKAMTLEEAERLATEKYRKQKTAADMANVGIAARAKRVDALIEDIKAWSPPSDNHEGLKKFMLSQLQETKEYDCKLIDAPKLHTGEQYKADQIKSAEWSIKFNGERMIETRDSNRERADWVKALCASLGDPPQGIK